MFSDGTSEIFSPDIASSGNDKINWVIPNMPVLAAIEKRFQAEKPFAGLTAAISIHLEAKTAYFAKVLKSGGAKVYVTGCNPLSTQNDVAAALYADGFAVNAVTGASAEEYHKHLCATLRCKPDFIVDDGGDLLNILLDEHPEYAVNLRGGCEETTTGVHRMRARAAAGLLKFPMIAVNDAKSKHLFDNRYGTGQSVWDAILHTTNLMVTGKNVVVAGYGYCGKGVAKVARAIGANVFVTEVDPHAALEARLDGNTVISMKEAAPLGDIFVTVTGCKDVITKEHFEMMKDNAILCNAGHFDVEVNVAQLREMSVRVYERKPSIMGYVLPNGKTLNVLGEGRLVNLAAGNGHPAEIMDMSFSLQCLCCEYIVKHHKELPQNAVTEVPEFLDRIVADIKLRETGIQIDRLTEEQKRYLTSW